MSRLKPTECQAYLDVNFIGNALDISRKETVAYRLGRLLYVVPRCFASCRLVTTVVVVYVTMQAIFGGGKSTS